jgi:Cu-processing system permease protein
MGSGARALPWHARAARARDRWVVVISLLFALLATAVSLYARSAGSAINLTGPSLVTLVSLLVPLVALVLGHDAIVGERERNTLGLLLSLPVTKLEVVASKFLGRLLAMACAVTLGLGAAIVVAPRGDGAVLAALIVPTLLLGAAFLSLGVLISAAVTRQISAASLVVTAWFVLVFFYDLALLGLLVVTDGGLSQRSVAWLVFANPAGLFRVQMMERFAGPEVLHNLGMTVALPGPGVSAALWSAWLVVPIAASALLLARRKAER